MKSQLSPLIRNTLLRIYVIIVLCSAVPALGASARVAILPFDMHAEKDLTFLQDGIMDMLGSRLAYENQVEVINPDETRSAMDAVQNFGGESRALLVGGKLKADWVLYGSITMFGGSLSIDAKMVDVTSRQAPQSFFSQAREMGEVIPQINRFANQINETVFGRGVPKGAATASTSSGPSSVGEPGPTIDPRMHPEKLLQSGDQPEK